MHWHWGLLTTTEAERTLKASGIDPDCSKWTTADCVRAEEILATAVATKRDRLMRERSGRCEARKN